MRCHGAKRTVSAQRKGHGVPSGEQSRLVKDVHASSGPFNQGTALPGTPVERGCSGISTERIMHAVERQRRITQQLDNLRAQQRQRTAFLRTTGLKLIAWLGCVLGLLISAFVVVLVYQPVLLVRTLILFSSFIALLLAVGADIQAGLLLLPSNNWVLSGAALVVVLMMVMWLHLMRYPREA